MKEERVLFMSKSMLNHIQMVMDDDAKRNPSHSKINWFVIKSIDNQAGGNYPKNYTW